MTQPPSPENQPNDGGPGEEAQTPPRYAPPQYGQSQYAPQQHDAPRYGQPRYAPPQYAPPQVSGSYGQQPYAAPAPPPYYGSPGPGEPFDGAATPEDLSRPLYGAAFGQALRRFVRNYAKFSGRASRSEYWWVQLFFVLLFAALGVLYAVAGILLGIGTSVYESGDGSGVVATTFGGVLMTIGGVLMLGFLLAAIVPSLAITWRRLHDAGLAGPFFFLSLLPVGDLVVLIFTILGPKPEGRRFDF